MKKRELNVGGKASDQVGSIEKQLAVIGSGTRGQKREAVMLLSERARAGDASSAFVMGMLCATGKAVKQSLKEAVKWYETAVNLGHPWAAFILGSEYYYFGRGLKKDLGKARRCLEFAAFCKVEEAGVILGQMCVDGSGGEVDLKAARKWFGWCAKKGNAEALRRLGVMHFNGEGGRVNVEKGVECYRRAVKLGDAVAMYNLGLCYQFGDGVRKSKKLALRMFKRSGKSGYKMAAKRVVEMEA